MPRNPKGLSAVSLFSNCGAGDIGFRKAGFVFDVVAEVDERRLAVAALNHPEAVAVPGDLRRTWTKVVEQYRARRGQAAPFLLAACPPCQGMSSVQSERGDGQDADAGCRDPRNLLVLPIAHVAKALKPLIIVVENVPAFLTRKVRHPETKKPIAAAKLLASLLENDYDTYPFVAELADYGVPQTRRRAFLTLVRKDQAAASWMVDQERIPYPVRTHDGTTRPRRTVKDALASLPALSAGDKNKASDRSRPLHMVPFWPDHRFDMVAAIPPGTGRSAWENTRCVWGCEHKDLSTKAATCPTCGNPLLRPVVKARNGRWRLITGFATSYRRMLPDQPAPTITTASGHVGSDRTIHFKENRLLSVLECALLQTIPASFRWGQSLKKYGHTFVRTMVGEAVPPRFTELHGRVLVRLLRAGRSANALATDEHRYVRACKTLGIDAPAKQTKAA